MRYLRPSISCGKPICIALLGFLLALHVCAQVGAPLCAQEAEQRIDEIRSVLESTGGAKAYPDANSLTVFERVEIEYEANGDFTEASGT